tara:strand:- start:4275 stop:4778 length:504 start_codon:yes stop_codon:yes gene_type:complete
MKGINESFIAKISNLFFYNNNPNINNFNYFSMIKKFNQISNRPGFIKNNGGLLFRKINNNKFEFKTKIKKIHLNRSKKTHGGYICSIIDAGSGTAAHAVINGNSCVTISLEIKFTAPTKLHDEILGIVEINKKTNSLVFLRCTLKSKKKIVATASGIWKILNLKFQG